MDRVLANTIKHLIPLSFLNSSKPVYSHFLLNHVLDEHVTKQFTLQAKKYLLRLF